MKIKIIAGFKPGPYQKPIHVGEVLEARVAPGSPLDFNRPYQCIDGPHSGVLIPQKYAVELSKERTYTEAEVQRLHKQIDDLRRTLRKESELCNRWMKKCDVLRDELSKAREGKKVKLPREVAEVIKSFRDSGRDIDYIVRALVARNGRTPTSRLQTLLNYAVGHGYELISALVNGYTIEDSVSPLEKEVVGIIAKWESAEPVGTMQKDREHLARQILQRIKQENVRKSG